MSARDPVPVWAVRVEQGRLVVDRKYDFARYVATREGKLLELVLRPRQAERSQKQAGYYYGVVCEMIREHNGEATVNDVHRELAKMFLAVPGDHLIPHVRSWGELTTQEKSDHIDRSIHWAATFLNLVIPDPGCTESPWATD